MENSKPKGDLEPSIKLAIAMAIVQSRRHKNLPPPFSSSDAVNSDPQAFRSNTKTSDSDPIKWKLKAKLRKQEILRLKEDLKIAEDGMHCDVFPQHVSCKCYFYDDLGELSSSFPRDECDDQQRQHRYSDVLRRRFLRQVRLNERKRRRVDGSMEKLCISESAIENEMEQLRASVDFLVDLCETSSTIGVEEGNFKNWSHQAVDFILATLKALSTSGKIEETVESIISSLIVRLIRRMCNGSQGDELLQCHSNFQFYVHHLMRKLGSDPFVGQRVILAVSQRISIVAESVLFMDPFDGAFPIMHNCMYIMIQLIEFLISDHLLSWSSNPDLDSKLLEEWVISVFNAKKALELLESRNALYILYMDRIVGDLTRHLGQVSFIQNLRPDTLAKLFG